MQAALRHSRPARVVAVGFIAMIFFGNLWLVQALLGQAAPDWMRHGFAFGLVACLLGGIFLLALAVYLRMKQGSAASDETEVER